MFRALTLATLALAAVSPIAAQTIAFAPPAGTKLILTIDRAREAKPEGRPAQSDLATSREEVAIARDGAGFLLTWRSLAATSPQPDAALLVGRLSAALSATPIEVPLDAAARAGPIRNWPAVKAALNGVAAAIRADMPAKLASYPAARQAQARAAFERPAIGLEQLTEEGARRQLLREALALFGWGGVRAGAAPVVSATTLRIDPLGREVAARREVRAARAGDAVALSAVTTADPAAVKTAREALVDEALANTPPADREAERAQMLAPPPPVAEERLSVTLDPATGLPREGRLVRTTTTPGLGTQSFTSTIRIAPAT